MSNLFNIYYIVISELGIMIIEMNEIVCYKFLLGLDK